MAAPRLYSIATSVDAGTLPEFAIATALIAFAAKKLTAIPAVVNPRDFRISMEAVNPRILSLS